MAFSCSLRTLGGTIWVPRMRGLNIADLSHVELTVVALKARRSTNAQATASLLSWSTKMGLLTALSDSGTHVTW